MVLNVATFKNLENLGFERVIAKLASAEIQKVRGLHPSGSKCNQGRIMCKLKVSSSS